MTDKDGRQRPNKRFVCLIALLFIVIRTTVGYFSCSSLEMADAERLLSAGEHVQACVVGSLSDVPNSGTGRACPPYAGDHWVPALGVEEGDLALCAPDGLYARVGTEANSALVLDMGEGNEIIDQAGTDFYYYERAEHPGILLDEVEVAVARDAEAVNGGAFTTVFAWGDTNSDNNGTIPPEYLPEGPNRPIRASDLYQGTGIGINIGNDDGQAYRFVRFQTCPSSAAPGKGKWVEIDALQSASSSPPITPSPTPSPTTPSPTTPPPTTPPPTTPVPTTPAPTTPPPTTAWPTTAIPTTPAPTTAVPTTPVPATSPPTQPPPHTPAPTDTPPTPSPMTSVAPMPSTPSIQAEPSQSPLASTPTPSPTPSSTATFTCTPTSNPTATLPQGTSQTPEVSASAPTTEESTPTDGPVPVATRPPQPRVFSREWTEEFIDALDDPHMWAELITSLILTSVVIAGLIRFMVRLPIIRKLVERWNTWGQDHAQQNQGTSGGNAKAGVVEPQGARNPDAAGNLEQGSGG
jgi:hypothetical protein